MEKCPKPVRRLTRYGYCYYYKLRSAFKLIRDWWRYDTIRFRLGVDQSESKLRAPNLKSNLAIATMETFQLLARNQVWFSMVLITRKFSKLNFLFFQYWDGWKNEKSLILQQELYSLLMEWHFFIVMQMKMWWFQRTISKISQFTNGEIIDFFILKSS